MAPVERAHAIRRALTFSRDLDISATVVGYVLRHASRHPSRLAIVEDGRRASYSQLANRVVQLRAALVDAGCQRADVVAVPGPRTAETIAAFLALESIGAVYLPFDPSWPLARRAAIAQHCRSALVPEHTPSIAAPFVEFDIPVVRSSGSIFDSAGVVPLSGEPLLASADERQARYVIYTSGTTGSPKGAIIEHRGMVNHLWSKVFDLGLRSSDVVAFTAPVAFDISIWQMLAALLVGGSVAVVGDNDVAFPQRLTSSLRRSGATVVELVPTVLGWLVEDMQRRSPDERLPRLRWLISTGEELRVTLAERIQRALPRVRLLNAYGPTECSDDVTHQVVQPGDLAGPRLPVGRPISNVSLYVLVESGSTWRAANVNEPGELIVGGLPVGAGYLDDPGATRAAFFRDVVDPRSRTGRLYRTGDVVMMKDDGLLYFLGRRDRQVKVAGVRIEIGEVEAALELHPGISRCAVTTTTDGGVTAAGRTELVANYVPARDPLPPHELRAYLREMVPEAMIPRRWRAMPALPLTANSKVDYHLLGAT